MARIQITLTVDDELADPEHETGLTNEGYEAVIGALSSLGFDIEIDRASA